MTKRFMKILVTGINGFVGKHLAREVHSRGHKVLGVGREATVNSEIGAVVDEYFVCELTNKASVASLPLGKVDAVISLAGLANVADSFKNAASYMHINVAVLSVLGKKLIESKSAARVLAISTGAVYNSGQPLPLSENSKIVSKGSPYALSKIAMEKAAKELRKQGLDCVLVRPFNHIGPGQESGFLVPDLYDKINRALEHQQAVKVGNLKTRRDYTDVRDVVRAYADLATTPKLSYDLYNVCSSRSVPGEEILERLLADMGATGKVRIEIDQALIRPDDPLNLCGSYGRLAKDTEWSPKIDINKTISDFVDSRR